MAQLHYQRVYYGHQRSSCLHQRYGTFGRAENPSGALPGDHHTILGDNKDTISRLHAYITCQQLPDGARGWLLKDNKSTNGLLLGRQRLDQGDETVLKDGDQIAFGG